MPSQFIKNYEYRIQREILAILSDQREFCLAGYTIKPEKIGILYYTVQFNNNRILYSIPASHFWLAPPKDTQFETLPDDFTHSCKIAHFYIENKTVYFDPPDFNPRRCARLEEFYPIKSVAPLEFYETNSKGIIAIAHNRDFIGRCLPCFEIQMNRRRNYGT